PIPPRNILKGEERRAIRKESAIARGSGHSSRDQRVTGKAQRRLITQRSSVQIRLPQPILNFHLLPEGGRIWSLIDPSLVGSLAVLEPCSEPVYQRPRCS